MQMNKEVVKRLIKERGVTKKFLAEQVGVAPYTLSRWLTGVSHPKNKHLEKMAEVLGVDETQLLESKASVSPDINFDTQDDVEFAYEYTRSGLTKVWLDGDLVWETKRSDLQNSNMHVRRTTQLAGGGVAKAIVKALRIGLQNIQEEI